MPSEAARHRPNPERRSDSAVLCLCIGVGLLAAAWFLGVGGVLTAALAGDATAAAGGFAAMLLLPLAGASGAILIVVGAIWLVVRVVIDQREDHARERYSRDVER
ncbi:MAG: hypothetical protein AB7M12_05390 [Hyphomonadaceae bacterium]